MGGKALREGAHDLQNIRLVQGSPIHIDGVGVVVDVHRLAAHSDDALDNGGAAPEGLGAQYHHIPLLRLVANGLEQEHVPVVEGGHHGFPVYPDDAAYEGEDQNEPHQGHDQGLEPEVEVHLQGVGAGEGGFFLLRLLRWMIISFLGQGRSTPDQNKWCYYILISEKKQGWAAGPSAQGRGSVLQALLDKVCLMEVPVS